MADSTDRNEEEKPDKYIVLDLNDYPAPPSTPFSQLDTGEWVYTSEDESKRYVPGTEKTTPSSASTGLTSFTPVMETMWSGVWSTPTSSWEEPVTTT